MEITSAFGWIGLGDIGKPMALQLIGAGHRVRVWGRTPERLQPALDAGATAAASPAELAAACDAVFLCVTDGDAVEEVVFGPQGVADGARRGSVVIDHSTIHPETARLASRRLASSGVAWVDAPVSGGAVGAKAGTLSVFLGGDDADVARVTPWLSAYARNVTHMGPAGSGQATKSCNQAVVAASIALWAEVIAYARRCGLDPDRVVDALAGGWADSESGAYTGTIWSPDASAARRPSSYSRTSTSSATSPRKRRRRCRSPPPQRCSIACSSRRDGRRAGPAR